eukprot:SAG31_NODE_31762_length_364_cov_1.124528_1_plen_51_part_01
MRQRCLNAQSESRSTFQIAAPFLGTAGYTKLYPLFRYRVTPPPLAMYRRKV